MAQQTKMRPYKGMQDKRQVRGVCTRKRSVLKMMRTKFNRTVRHQSRLALALCSQTEGDYDQNNFLVSGEWVY